MDLDELIIRIKKAQRHYNYSFDQLQRELDDTDDIISFSEYEFIRSNIEGINSIYDLAEYIIDDLGPKVDENFADKNVVKLLLSIYEKEKQLFKLKSELNEILKNRS